MKLKTEPYLEQRQRWPASGRHILAQFDDESVVVYQAYRPEIGHFAAEHGYFGGAFSLDRMSWIKPNFLWMMFRSGWGTKEGQEVTLAVWLRRSAFDAILKEAVHSTFVPEVYASQDEWKQAVARSSVRLQWDPDHDPSGAKVERAGDPARPARRRAGPLRPRVGRPRRGHLRVRGRAAAPTRFPVVTTGELRRARKSIRSPPPRFPCPGTDPTAE